MDGESRPRCRLLILGLMLACGFWVLDAAVDSLFFSRADSFWQALITTDPKSLWMRLLMVGVLTAFAAFAQRAVTKRKADAHTLRLSRKVFERASEGILITDAHNRIIDVNRAMERLSGYTRLELLGRDPAILASGRHDREFYRRMWQAINDTGHWSGEIWDRRKNGDVYPKWMSIDTVHDEAGNTVNYFAVVNDITALKAEQAQLASLAYRDPLTRLPNRRLLEDRLNRALALAERSHAAVAVLFIDLDGFKAVNDRFGHRAGDQLLIEASERIQAVTRGADTLARLAGDEFVLMLPDLRQPGGEAQVAQKVCEVVAQPLECQGTAVTVGASIGIALYPLDADCAVELVRRADAAMYSAKRSGRGRFCYYDRSTMELGEQPFGANPGL